MSPPIWESTQRQGMRAPREDVLWHLHHFGEGMVRVGTRLPHVLGDGSQAVV